MTCEKLEAPGVLVILVPRFGHLHGMLGHLNVKNATYLCPRLGFVHWQQNRGVGTSCLSPAIAEWLGHSPGKLEDLCSRFPLSRMCLKKGFSDVSAQDLNHHTTSQLLPRKFASTFFGSWTTNVIIGKKWMEGSAKREAVASLRVRLRLEQWLSNFFCFVPVSTQEILK